MNLTLNQDHHYLRGQYLSVAEEQTINVNSQFSGRRVIVFEVTMS